VAAAPTTDASKAKTSKDVHLIVSEAGERRIMICAFSNFSLQDQRREIDASRALIPETLFTYLESVMKLKGTFTAAQVTGKLTFVGVASL
jgi:hypothetical protein